MKHTKRTNQRWTMKSILPLAVMVAAVIGLVMPAMAGPLPREPMPRPHFPITRPGVPKPPIHLGTQPTINIHHPVALPDLKIVRVTPRINSRVAGICRTGRKGRPGSSIDVLNFDVVVKNVGRGTARMDRYGVILSAQTMDFHERVFDTSKLYQGGTGGPGHFQGPHGTQAWRLVRMGPIAPGASFTAHSHLGIGRNNTRFTIARMHELAGQTHRFRIKLTSYGSPGLKESNIRNNTYIVSYTFPRNFCQPAVSRPGIPKPPIHLGTQPTINIHHPVTLPDLKIVRVTPKLIRQARNACRTGRSPNGMLVDFDVQVKNIGAGMADLSRYMFAVDATSADGKAPAMGGGDGYSRARRTPARVAPGQTFTVHGATSVGGYYYGHPVTFPVSRFSELAGKTRRFKVEIVKMGIAPLIESNYRNNSRIVSFTFPQNFCKATIHGGISQPVPTLPDFIIKTLTPPNRFACGAGGVHNATGLFSFTFIGVIQNKGGDPTYPASEASNVINFNMARRVTIPGTRLYFSMTGGIRYRDLPKANQSISWIPSVVLRDVSKPNGRPDSRQLAKAMRWLRGRTVDLPVQVNGPRIVRAAGKPVPEGNTRNNISTLRVTFPGRLCQNLTTTTQAGGTTVHLHPATSDSNSGRNAHQNGGRTVTVRVPGSPDLEISRIAISGPVPSCFNRGIYQIWGSYYTLGRFHVNITLHNRGSATYTTHDSVHNKNLPIGIIGDRYVGPPGRHHDSLCAGPDRAYRISNLVLPAGASKTIQAELSVDTCFINDNRVVNMNGRLAEPLVRSIMGQVRSIKLGIGKAVFIRNNIPVESNYDNNFRSFPFRFPNRTCGGR